MGTPAFSNVIVRFNSEENAARAAGAFQAWTDKAFLGGLEDPNDCINGDYCIEDIDWGDLEVTFTVSGRIQNCTWQCENIRDFFKTQEGCEQFEAGIMIRMCEESVMWTKGEE